MVTKRGLNYCCACIFVVKKKINYYDACIFVIIQKNAQKKNQFQFIKKNRKKKRPSLNKNKNF